MQTDHAVFSGADEIRRMFTDFCAGSVSIFHEIKNIVVEVEPRSERGKNASRRARRRRSGCRRRLVGTGRCARSFAGTTTGNDRLAGIQLLWGSEGVEYNFGELLASSIRGRVHADLDDDFLFVAKLLGAQLVAVECAKQSVRQLVGVQAVEDARLHGRLRG